MATQEEKKALKYRKSIFPVGGGWWGAENEYICVDTPHQNIEE
jgi:hypothetical protein